MEKESFLELINTNEEAKQWLNEAGYDLFNNERVEKYLTTTDEGKKILFSKNDKYHNEQLIKWKDKNLAVEVEKLYQQKHPELTEEQKEINMLKAQLQAKEEMETKYNNIKQLKELNKEYCLPDDIFELLITADLDSSKKKITEFGSKYKDNIENIVKLRVDELLKGTNKPTGGGTMSHTYSKEEINSMTKSELMKLPSDVLKSLMKQ